MSGDGGGRSGLAVLAHGFARATQDVDAAIVADPSEAAELLELARRYGLAPRTLGAERLAAENLVLRLTHTASGADVDVSFALQPFELLAAREAVVRTLSGVRLRVPSLTAPLTYKLVAGREKDLLDARALLQTKQHAWPSPGRSRRRPAAAAEAVTAVW